MKIDKNIDEVLEEYKRRFSHTVIFTEKEGNEILQRVRSNISADTDDLEVIIEMIYTALFVGFMKGLDYREPSVVFNEALVSGKH